MNYGLIALIIILPNAIALGAASKEAQLSSPDRAVRLRLFQRENRLTYEVSFRGRPVIEASPLVLMLDDVTLTEGAEMVQTRSYMVKETYPWRGVHSRATINAAGLDVEVKHPRSKMSYSIEFRAFNDGVAFRQVIPGDHNSRTPDEATSFKLPARSTVWYHDLEGHYEAVHQKKDVTEIAKGQWAAPPVTFKLPNGGGYATITEAALVNYSGMAFQAGGDREFKLVLGDKHHVSYPFRLRYSNDVERLSKPAAIAGSIISPWRVIIVGSDLNTLVNSDIIGSLCPPPDSKLSHAR